MVVLHLLQRKLRGGWLPPRIDLITSA